MRFRTTLAVLLLGLLAFAAIRLLGDPPVPPPARSPLIDAALLDGWEQIECKLLSGSRFRLERRPGGGVLIRFGSDGADTTPLDFSDAADREQVKALLQALRDSWREPLQGSPDDRLRAGVEVPRSAVTVRGGGREVTIGYGNDDPAGSGILAYDRAAESLFRTGRQVANLCDSNLKSWRDRAVFPFDVFAIDEVELRRDPPDPDLPAELITVVREGGLRDWRMLQPRSLVADPEACRALAQQCSLLRIQNFVSQKWRRDVNEVSGLPDHPQFTITLSAGDAVVQVKVGKYMDNPGGYAATCEQRDPELAFTIEKEGIERLLAVTVDSLRPRRLFPRIESMLVALRCDAPDGSAKWRVEREGLHPKGRWNAAVPFAGPMNPARGRDSFGQVVADLDRIEVDAFLPPDTPFAAEARITLQWKADPVLPVASFEVARDGERTLLRDPKQPGELFAVGRRLGELIDLDLELCRDLTFFPRAEWAPRLLRWRLAVPGRETLEAVRADSNQPPAAGPATPPTSVADLTSATEELLDKPCVRYVRAAAALAAADSVDPFRTVAFELLLDTVDRSERLVVSGGAEAPEGGLYCKLLPRLPNDVWMVVPRPVVERLLRLATK